MRRPHWLIELADRLRLFAPGRLLLRAARLGLRTARKPRRVLEAVLRRTWKLRYRLRQVLRRGRDRRRRRRYAARLRAGRPAGRFVYREGEWTWLPGYRLDLLLPAGRGIEPPTARDWCYAQTLEEFRAMGFESSGKEVWRISRWGTSGGATSPSAAQWFYAPGRLVDVYPAFLESALWVVIAEDIDAVVLLERLEAVRVHTAEQAHDPELRPFTVFNARAYAYDAKRDAVRPTRERRLIKVIERDGIADDPRTPGRYHQRRRGSYLTSYDLGAELEVAVRDAARLPREHRVRPGRTPMLVLVPFLAHGGAEHTLFETLLALEERFSFTFITLAPHRAELGDRRSGFHQISPRIFALGDLVHPVVMPGLLVSELEKTGAEVVYNANGTTLFYEFAPLLKERFPTLRIVDHLYDHRVGYIDRYRDPGLLEHVDAVVAENHRIAGKLIDDHGWSPERVPVIWPCGRRADAFPTGEEAERVRAEIRRELGYRDDDLVILTAARMHAQKRPLDLVRLADRLRDVEHLHLLIVGGGDLESKVDRAIAIHGEARVRRLPFRDDIPHLIAACDVGSLVSDYEGLPVFMIECLQSGRPFLGTDVGEMGRVLKATGAGIVVETPGDLDALEAAVRQLVDPDLRARLAASARAAAAEFAVETCAERYAAAFLGREAP